MHAFIRLLPSLLIAGSLIAFVAVGASTVSQAPKYPTYPSCYDGAAYGTSQYNSCQSSYDKVQKDFDAKSRAHDRTLTLVSLPAAVVAVLAGDYLIRRSEVIGEGIALGGVGVAIYAIITSVDAEARVLTFVSLSALLIGALLLGWRRFGDKPNAPPSTFG